MVGRIQVGPNNEPAKGWAWYNTLAHHLKGAVSIVSKSPHLTHSIEWGMDYPAATTRRGTGKKDSNGHEIHDFHVMFNPSLLGNDIALWLGAAWHEMGHILWSPWNSLRPPPHPISFNLLEDARVEALLLHKYPKIGPGLFRLVETYLNTVISSSGPLFAYAWICGRMYFPKEVRVKVRSLLTNSTIEDSSSKAKEIERIFTEYLKMGGLYDGKKAFRLSTELHDIIKDESYPASKISKPCTIPGGSYDRKAPLDKSIGNLPVPEMDLDSNDGSGSNDSASSDGAGNSSSNDDASNDSKEKDIEKAKADREQAIKKATDYLRQEVNSSEELKEEVEAITKILAKGRLTGLKPKTQRRNAPDDLIKALTNRVRRAALKFNDDSKKGLVRRRDNGRFKPYRMETYDNLDIAYDQWEPGLEQEMFLALLLDMSGSMNPSTLSDTAYILEQGLSEVAEVKTYGFNTEYIPLKPNSPNVCWSTPTSGGTDPTQAIEYASQDILGRGEQNRLLLIYTDGVWSDYEEPKELLLSLTKQGITVRILVEGDYHYTQTRSTLSPLDVDKTKEIADLPNVVLKWTQEVLTK